MSFFNALGTWGWLALLAVPPLIVLLYFLKLRRRPVLVPSTYLWKKTLEDMHVNSLWQRLRNNLLLFLQVLTVLIMALACLRPGCQGERLSGDRFIFLIDKSASMSATDVPAGNRLEDAKRQVANLIDRMQPEDSAMLIAFSDQAEVVQSYTQSKSLLRQKLDSIRTTQRPTHVQEALVAAAGLANPGRTLTDDGYQQLAAGKEATLLIFSDGGFPEVNDFSLGNLKPEYHAIGAYEPPVNVAITAFAVSEEGQIGSKREAFAQIRNSSPNDQMIDLTLNVENVLFDAQKNVVVPAGRSVGVSFPLAGLLESLNKSVELRLEIEQQDQLSLDNSAYLVVNPPRKVQVLLVSPGNDYLRLALETEPVQRLAQVRIEPREFLENPEFQRKATLGEFDLILFDQCQPKSSPNCNAVYLAQTPPGDSWQLGEKQYPSPIVDFLRTHPLMASLNLASLLILEARKIEGPPGMISLLDSTYGSIMAVAPRGGFQDLVLAFTFSDVNTDGDVQVNTDWPGKLSFPLFVQNLISILGGGVRSESSSMVKPGQLINLRPPQQVSRVVISSPDGQRFEVERGRDNLVPFSHTEVTGVYRVDPLVGTGQEEPEPQLFSVNLFDPRESDLSVRENLEIGYEQIPAQVDKVPEVQEYWKWIVGAALVLMMLEWYIYNRRVII